MPQQHPWKLLAPWYRWDRQLTEENRKPLGTRPVFQKFDNPAFLQTFVSDPQKSLRFVDNVDRVFNVQLSNVGALASGIFAGRFTRLFIPKPEPGQPKVAKNASLSPTTTRKLYLPSHSRHYLVVCELHCDAPGLPAVDPAEACEAGFVVRRRSYQFPNGAQAQARERLETIMSLQTEIGHLEGTAPAHGYLLKRRTIIVERLKKEGKLESTLAELRQKLAAARADLLVWKWSSGVVEIDEGWLPGAFQGIGSWQIVSETPQQLLESTFPMFRLFPDPAIKDHSAAGKTIYYGLVPTSSLDTNPQGTARFDPDSLYEIRCYVRRHDPNCRVTEQKPDCNGELIWSLPTESYRLAPPTDLVGTGQRPITIQMPDLGELAAQAAAFPPNRLSPVKVIQPQQMTFDIKDGKGENGAVLGIPQICFFSIPLITIIAMFVLKLFLPIVVFLFGLFFLLQLKFCIPPSVSIDADLKLALEAVPPSLEAQVDVDVSLGGTALNDLLVKGIAADAGIKAAEDIDKLGQYSNAALLPLGRTIQNVSAVGFEEVEAKATIQITADLEYEPRVEVKIS